MIGVEEVFGFIGIGRHRMLRTLLSSYIDGEVSAPEATRLEKHLSECDECRRELETLMATVHLLRELPELEPPRSFAPESVPAPPEVARGYVWVPRLATSLAAGLLVVLLLGDVSGVLSQSDKAVTATAELESAAAAVAAPATLPADVPTPAPASAMAAAAPPPPEQPKEEVVVESEEEAEAVPAAAPVPAPAMAAAAAPPDEQPEKQTVVEDAAPPVKQGEAATPLRREPSPVPREAAIAAEMPPGGSGDGGGVALPLRQLELATGIVLVVLILVVVWAARRGRRWSP